MAKVKGIWVFHNVLTAAGNEGAITYGQDVVFTSNGSVFDRLIPLFGYESVMTYSNIEFSYSVYSHSDGWTNEAFKTINFGSEQEVTDEFYTWLTANATPEADEPDEPDEPMTGEYYAIKKATLEGIGNAVRSKTGKSGKIPVVSLATEIEGISVGSTLPKFDGTVEVV
jgi:hypothetical protein